MTNDITINLQDAIERGWVEERTVKPIGHLCPEMVTYGQIDPEMFGLGVSLHLTVKPDGTKKYWYLFTRIATNDRWLMGSEWYSDINVRRATWGEVWDADNASEADRQKFEAIQQKYGSLTNNSTGYLITSVIKEGRPGEKYGSLYRIVFIADDWSKDAEPIRFKESGIYSD